MVVLLLALICLALPIAMIHPIRQPPLAVAVGSGQRRDADAAGTRTALEMRQEELSGLLSSIMNVFEVQMDQAERCADDLARMPFYRISLSETMQLSGAISRRAVPLDDLATLVLAQESNLMLAIWDQPPPGRRRGRNWRLQCAAYFTGVYLPLAIHARRYASAELLLQAFEQNEWTEVLTFLR